MYFISWLKRQSLVRILIIISNIAVMFLAIDSGILDRLLGYWLWHWDARNWYEFICLLFIPVVNILYLSFSTSDSNVRNKNLVALWVERRRLEEQGRIRELEKKTNQGG